MKLILRKLDIALNVQERTIVNVKFANLACVKTVVIGVRAVSRRFVSVIAQCVVLVKNVLRATSAAQLAGTRVVKQFFVKGVLRVEKKSHIAIFVNTHFARLIDKRRIAIIVTRVSVQTTRILVVETVMD